MLMAPGAVGFVRFWRSGRRMVPLVVGLYPLMLTIWVSYHGMRSRYPAPIEPLMLLLIADGLAVVWKLAAWKFGKAAPLGLAARAAAVVATVVIVVNLPHIARNAFYYSYRSHGSDFYTVIRGGRWRGTVQAARLLRMEAWRRIRWWRHSRKIFRRALYVRAGDFGAAGGGWAGLGERWAVIAARDCGREAR